MEFLQWGLGESKVAGIFPWHWKTYGGIDQDYGIGLVDLPRCRQTYNAIGELVRSAGPGWPSAQEAAAASTRLAARSCPTTPFNTNYPFCSWH